MTISPADSGHERTDLTAALAKRRQFLRQTVVGLTDDQAGERPTPSELCLAGIIKHVAAVEESWIDFIEHGPAEIDMASPQAAEGHANTFRVLPGETLASLLERYDAVAGRTEKLISDLPSLDQSQPLPSAPWFEPGAHWSARTVLLHIVAETAHHSGHADIIREAIDGARTMG